MPTTWWLGGRNSYKKSHHRANLNFLCLTLCAYLFKNCPSQLLSYWEVAQPVFCSEELSCLPYKNQNKSLNLSSLAGNLLYGENLHTRVSSPEPPLLLAPRILRPSYGPVLERNQVQAQLSFPETQLSKSIYYANYSRKKPNCERD